MAKVDPMGEALLEALGIDLSHHDVLGAALVWKPGQMPRLTVAHVVDGSKATVTITAKRYRLVPDEDGAQ